MKEGKMIAREGKLDKVIANVPQWSTIHWQEMVTVFDEEQDPPRRPEEEQKITGRFINDGDCDKLAGDEKEIAQAGWWANINWDEIGSIIHGSEESLKDVDQSDEIKGQD